MICKSYFEYATLLNICSVFIHVSARGTTQIFSGRTYCKYRQSMRGSLVESVKGSFITLIS